MKTQSNLEKVLSGGHLAVTSECGPPRGASAQTVVDKAKYLEGVVDAVNITDNQTAVVRMSSLAGSVLVKQQGMNPLLQMVTRDRNRLAMQADILGAYALGIDTMLCLSGDHTKFGDHAMAANVHDIDSIQLIQMVKGMRDEGKFQGGAEIKGVVPKMYIGAAANPFADPFELRVMRLAKKIAAGADFIQTQCIFNIEKFEKWMEGVRKMGLHEKCYILAGITPMKSVGAAKYMKNRVPGMDVPQELVDRMSGVAKEDQPAEGIKICLETMERLKEVEGVAGFHIMAIDWEEKVEEIVKQAGLYPRPQV
ncbi:MAG: methylenetetrahydrofolate reductase [Desulfofustis sp. PB-SRB1]|jgi:methylenetetrahydrofolate reductase (NADPH)|nr:methylenetetrahydrofolate reductase [Desulfofustis sp. PB-SRB1]MBM1002469.1 methylenetetrahydrofolate reductase [Desulfofustis sp. PB-SRB1]HBH29797.1 methylenetetrahydrofolate reductase [Desulfofustis sp.]HBH32519.1 methylenetetrahydrofolate reductase [Desulfofustis sp.]